MPERTTVLPAGKCFTLVELMVVIAIILVLIMLLMPSLRMAKERGQRAVCASNLRQIGIGWSLYLDDSDRWIPRMTVPTTNNPHWRLQTNADASNPADTSLNAPELEHLGLFHAGIRYCPTMGPRRREDFGGSAPTYWAWGYAAPLLHSPSAAGFYTPAPTHKDYGMMYGRRNKGYVRLIPGLAVHDDNWAWWTKGQPYISANTSKGFDPLTAFPLMAEQIEWDNSSNTGRCAPHNLGKAYTETAANVAPYPPLDSLGGNSLWLDGRVEWHVWPAPLRSWTLNKNPQVNALMLPHIREYPHELASGHYGRKAGWVGAGNIYRRYHFWAYEASAKP